MKRHLNEKIKEEIDQNNNNKKLLVTSSLEYESKYLNQEAWIIGTDECGVGCLSGPTTVAAFIMCKHTPIIQGVRDSKKLTEKKRELLFEKLINDPQCINIDNINTENLNNNNTENVNNNNDNKNHNIDTINAHSYYSIVNIDEKRIDEINIFQARMEGMQKAVQNLINYFITTKNNEKIGKVLIDGNKLPPVLEIECKNRNVEIEAIVKGDDKSYAIAAASILAKVTRDRLMVEMDKEFPQYGFKEHKGYCTKKHLEALEKYKPCKYHRKTFDPVKKLL